MCMALFPKNYPFTFPQRGPFTFYKVLESNGENWVSPFIYTTGDSVLSFRRTPNPTDFIWKVGVNEAVGSIEIDGGYLYGGVLHGYTTMHTASSECSSLANAGSEAIVVEVVVAAHDLVAINDENECAFTKCTVAALPPIDEEL